MIHSQTQGVGKTENTALPATVSEEAHIVTKLHVGGREKGLKASPATQHRAGLRSHLCQAQITHPPDVEGWTHEALL